MGPSQSLTALAQFTLESLSSHASRACWIKTFRIGQVLEKKTCNSFKTDKTPRTGEFSISPDKLICKLCQQFNRDGENKKNTFLFGEGSVVFYLKYIYCSRRTIYTQTIRLPRPQGNTRNCLIVGTKSQLFSENLMWGAPRKYESLN